MASYVPLPPFPFTFPSVPFEPPGQTNPPAFQRRRLDALIGGGSVAFCNTTTTTATCHIALSTGFNYPNGLIRGADNLIYVPTVMTGEIHVLSLAPPSASSSGLPSLKRLKVLQTGYPLDNLSLDKRTGDIYAAAFTSVRKTMKSFEDPFGLNPPSGVLRIRRLPGEGLEYEITKVLEDDGSALPASTVAVHDAGVPERFFMGSK
jgi:arylesterase / paraoxonase